MTFDVGRIRHDGALMHYSKQSNGSSTPSNWRLSATGDTGVIWTPESATAVSYGSNSNDVGNANAAGASSLASRADHVHRGVHLLSSNGSNSLFGDVNLAAGSGIALGVLGQTVTLTNTGSSGGGGGSGTLTTVKDEGTNLSTAVVSLDFTGAGVTASGTTAVTVNIPGGGSAVVPTIVQMAVGNTSATTITIAAAASGHSLILVTNSTTGQITSPTCTNVTWTQIKTYSSGGGSFYAIWCGLVAGGSSGTTITVTKPGSFNSMMVAEITDTLTATAGQTTASAGSATALVSIPATTAGHLIAIAGGPDNTSTGNMMVASIPTVGNNWHVATLLLGYSQGGAVYGNAFSSAGAVLIAEIT